MSFAEKPVKKQLIFSFPPKTSRVYSMRHIKSPQLHFGDVSEAGLEL